MANRKITVLNPAGYQELFQSGDNLLIDGSVNLQANTLTGLPTPGTNDAASNKEYVDDKTQLVQDDVDALEVRVTNVEAATGGIAVEDGTITFTGSDGITLVGNSIFSANQANDVTLNIAGPDLSGLLDKPSTDGEFIITKDGGNITYSDLIDLGTY